MFEVRGMGQHTHILAAESAEHMPVTPPFALPARGEGEAYRCWGVLCSTPGFYYRGEWVDFSVEDAQKCVDHHNLLLKEEGYEPPILVQHDPKHKDGANLGYAESLHLQVGTDGNTYLLAVLRWSDPGVEEKIDREEIRWLSPYIGPYTDDAGRSEDFVVLEVSVCSSPYQKRLGRKHLLSENLNTEEEDMEEILAQLEALKTAQDALSARLEACEASLAADAAEDDTEPAEGADEAGLEEDPAKDANGSDGEDDVPEMMAAVMAGVAEGLGLSEESQEIIGMAARTDIRLAARLITKLSTAEIRNAPAHSAPGKRISRPSTSPPAPAQTPSKSTLLAECLSEAKGDKAKAADLYEARSAGLR